MLPPAVEDVIAGRISKMTICRRKIFRITISGLATTFITNPEFAPAIGIEGRDAWDNDHASRVESKAFAQRLERALFPAPKQGREPIPFRRRCTCDQFLFFE